MSLAFETSRSGTPAYRRALFPMVAGTAVLAFLAAPWPIAVKSHVFLHGLCAQRPSHTLLFGGRALPFDARMTGIYAGFLLAAFVQVARGRHRAARPPRVRILVVAALLVAAMALDGFNSLFLDLNLLHFYPPSNALRLMTGAGVGIVFAGALSYLVAISLWRRPDVKTAAIDGKDLALLAAAQAPIAVFLTGWPALYVPLTLVLLISAVAVLSLLALVTLVLIAQLDNSFTDASDVQGHASLALVIGVISIALLAAARFLFERHFGPSPLV